MNDFRRSILPLGDDIHGIESEVSLYLHPSPQGPGQGECNQCALGYHQQEWLCVQHCSAGYYSREPARLRDKMCRKCEDNCVSCEGPGASCTQCREGFSLISRTCLAQGTCNNADEVFCDMVKSNWLCEKKLFRQFCCRTCLMTG
ncbi:proprotein convertase subtilisin/kexin type 6-like [Gadus macrocephalus]|uniref:proprotein convertase subtilisin/kexin type 6-like n=1 Tax=Gadus macrocephalus TaxID=80720 RepID=UPI0028CB6925|nr:proprotein convertase subtilisin/kexin type 6-like [Gadus macrocephalus]